MTPSEKEGRERDHGRGEVRDVGAPVSDTGPVEVVVGRGGDGDEGQDGD